MGGSIAALLARHGFRVRLRDIAPDAVKAGLVKVRQTFAALEKKRGLTRRGSRTRARQASQDRLAAPCLLPQPRENTAVATPSCPGGSSS